MKTLLMPIFKIIGLATLLLSLAGCIASRQPAGTVSESSSSGGFGIYSVTNLGGSPIGMQIQWEQMPGAVSYNIYLLQTNSSTGMPIWSLIESYTPTSALVNCLLPDASSSPIGPNCYQYIHRDASTLVSGSTYTYRVRYVNSSGTEDTNTNQLSAVAFPGIASVTITGTTSATVNVDTNESYNALKVTATPTRCGQNGTWTNSAATYPALAALCSSSIVTVNLSSKEAAIPVTGLIPGTSYNFNVQVYLSNTNGIPDGNSVNVIAQTNSIMYGSGAETDGTSVYGYRNVRLVQAFGDAPDEINTSTLSNAPSNLSPTTNPSSRMVNIVPNPPNGILSSSKIRVIRTSGTGLTGNSAPSAIDTTTQTPCTATATSSCVVCPSTTSSPVNGDCDYSTVDTSGNPSLISDVNVVDPTSSPPSIKYYYTITQIYNSYTINSVINNSTVQSTSSVSYWPEELPSINFTDFAFTVSVPDPYMTLVQRDSVNYEMCSLLGQSVDPRHYNRCSYSGLGATPYTTAGTAIPVAAGYYDFGYNLFADRHQLSCNWSRSAGSCTSANGCINIAQYTPADVGVTNTVGIFLNDASTPTAASKVATNLVNGLGYDVAYNLGNKGSNCFINTNSASGPPSWSDVGSAAVSANSSNNASLMTVLASATTADPGALSPPYSNRKQPVITGVTNTQAQNLCNIHQVSSGKRKRLLRRREYVAASGMPAFAGEPNYQASSTLRWQTLNGSAGQTFYDWSKADGTFGNGSQTGQGINPGACAVSQSKQALTDYTQTGYYCTPGTINVSYNTTVSKNSPLYCPLAANCSYVYNAVGAATSSCGSSQAGAGITCSLNLTGSTNTCWNGSILSDYLSVYNESTQVSQTGTNGMEVFTHPFFIGSLATNKCVSRFGIQDPYGAASQTVNTAFVARNTNSSLGILLMDTFYQQVTGSGTPSTTGGGYNNTDNVYQYEGDATTVSFSPVSNSLDLGVIHDYYYNGTSLANFGGVGQASSSFSMIGSERSRFNNCIRSDGPDTFNDYYVNNYYFFNINSNAGTIGSCNYTAGAAPSTLTPPEYNSATLPGYLPVLGIPLTSYAVSSGQQSVGFNTFLGNQLNQNPTDLLSYARSLILSANPETINMSTGLGSRWSFELSETPSIDAGATVLCGVEAE